MYNILLTDDEQIAIESLTITLNKNFQEQINLFTANSGMKAVEIVREHDIDIIFIDIHMPGINGLETLSLIKQINPKCIVIIVSAYDQFQYAQEALNIGAFKYLTKPVNRNMIVQTAREAMNIVDFERGKVSDNIELRQKVSVVSNMVESDFIYSCIFNNKGTDFAEYFSYFGIEGKDYFMACIEFPGIAGETRYEAYKKTRDILTEKCRCILGSFMGNRVGAFFPLENKTDFSKELLNSIFTQLSLKISANIKMGISSVESQIKDAQKAYNAAAAAISKIDSNGGIMFSGEHTKSQDNKEYIEKLSSKIIAAVRSGDTGAANELSRQYIDLLYNSYTQDEAKIKGALFELLIRARDTVLQKDSSYKNKEIDGAFSFFAQDKARQELERFVAARTAECASATSQMQTQEANPLVKRARAYIDSHLQDLPSLEQLASELNVSSFYLSRLFKEETGETYINYVTSARLEKAKELLADDSLRIKEITSLVGYNDQNYFSKLFKQKFGISPSEYKSSNA